MFFMKILCLFHENFVYFIKDRLQQSLVTQFELQEKTFDLRVFF